MQHRLPRSQHNTHARLGEQPEPHFRMPESLLAVQLMQQADSLVHAPADAAEDEEVAGAGFGGEDFFDGFAEVGAVFVGVFGDFDT